MKFIVSFACILLACQFAAAASVPAPFQTSDPETCALVVVDAVRTSVSGYYYQVEERFLALKETYEQCHLLIGADTITCLRAFAAYAINVVQGLPLELDAKRIILRQYALARLEDYYTCRNGDVAEARTPQLLCAVRTYEDAREALKPYTDALLANFTVLEERFVRCVALPEDLQATCLVSLFREATTIGRDVYQQAIQLRPVIVARSLELLEAYNTCRLA